MEPDLIELLAEYVHTSWMEEKQRQGFADHALTTTERQGESVNCADCFFPADKHHADMLPYAELPEHVKEYDRVTVRGVLLALARGGYDIVQVRKT